MISIVKSYEWNGWTAIRYELEVKEYAVMELEIQMYTKDRIPDVLSCWSVELLNCWVVVD